MPHSTTDCQRKERALLPPPLLRLVHWYTFQNEDDTFLDRVRKVVVSVMLILSIVPFVYVFYFSYLIFTNAQSETLGMIISTVDCALFVPTFSVPYFLARRRRKVEQWLMDSFVFLTFSHWIVITTCIPTYGNKTASIAYALIAILSQTRYIKLQMTMWVIVFYMDNFNQSYYRVGKAYFLVPGHRYGTPLEEFLGTASAQMGLSLVLVAVYFQSKEHEKQVAESKAAVVLCQRVVDLLRQYNTAGVDDALKSTMSLGVDPALVTSLSLMNVNLKTYKPYLPNFLFLDIMSASMMRTADSDEDDETVVEEQRRNVSDSIESFAAPDDSSNKSADLPTSSHDSIIMLNQNCALSTSSLVGHRPQPQNLSSSSLVSTGTITQVLLAVPQCTSELHCGVVLDEAHLRRKLTSYVNAVHKAIHNTFGSLHSMVGDNVKITWGATARMAQPELKATTFLLQLREALKTPVLGAAVFTGPAHFVSLMSNMEQHANLLLADWLCAATLMFRLARRYDVQLLCERTQSAVSVWMETCAVDIVYYRPHEEEVEEVETNDDDDDHDASSSPSLENAELLLCSNLSLMIETVTKKRQSFLYELIGELNYVNDSEDSEWMYRLQRQEREAAIIGGSAPHITYKILDLIANENDFSGAIRLLPKLNQNNEMKSVMTRRMEQRILSAARQKPF
eukprot:PhM_4_TR14167/c0_g1_i1/m.99692